MRLGFISIVDEQRIGAKRLQLCMPGKYRTSSDKKTLHQTTIERLSLCRAKVVYPESREAVLFAAIKQNDVPNTSHGDWHFKWLLEQYLGCADDSLESGAPEDVIRNFESVLGVSLRRRERQWLKSILTSCPRQLNVS